MDFGEGVCLWLGVELVFDRPGSSPDRCDLLILINFSIIKKLCTNYFTWLHILSKKYYFVNKLFYIVTHSVKKVAI